MKTKVIILISGYFLIGTIISCGDFCDHVKYSDFTKIEIVSLNNDIAITDSLNFQIHALDIKYMAKAELKANFFESANAFSCDEGWGGMKHPITKVEITSDSDFNNDHPGNTLLNKMVTVHAWIDGNRFEYMTLAEYGLSNVVWANLYIAERPTIDMSHNLTVKIYKSNGEIITAESEEITWK